MLTANDIAGKLGLSTQTVYRLHQTRQFPQATVNPAPGAKAKLAWAESVVDDWAQSSQGQDKLASYERRNAARLARLQARNARRSPARRSTAAQEVMR